MEGSQIFLIELPCDPTIPVLGVYLEKKKNLIWKGYMHPNIHNNTVYNN